CLNKPSPPEDLITLPDLEESPSLLKLDPNIDRLAEWSAMISSDQTLENLPSTANFDLGNYETNRAFKIPPSAPHRLLKATYPLSNDGYVEDPNFQSNDSPEILREISNYQRKRVKRGRSAKSQWIGCDTTSAISRKGKISVIKLYDQKPLLKEIATVFYDPTSTPDVIAEAGEKMFLEIYRAPCTQSEINRYRFTVSLKSCTKLKPDLSSLPPTKGSAKYHAYRVFHQVQEWLGYQNMLKVRVRTTEKASWSSDSLNKAVGSLMAFLLKITQSIPKSQQVMGPALAVSAAINALSKGIRLEHRRRGQLSLELRPTTTTIIPNSENSSPSLWSGHEKNIIDIDAATSSLLSTSDGMPSELKQYLDQPIIPRKENPTKFWFVCRHFTPVLSDIALKYLISPASSVSSERLAYAENLAVPNNRNRITAEHTISPNEFHTWTGLNHDQYTDLLANTPSVNNRRDSNARLATIFRTSESSFARMLKTGRIALMQDFVPLHLGFDHLIREDHVIDNEEDTGDGVFHWFYRNGDVFILDRGFRDFIVPMQQHGYSVHIPESKYPNETHRTTDQANKSRLITICRWVVEVVNGRFKRDFRLLRNIYINRTLYYMFEFFKIAAALINVYHRLIGDNIHEQTFLNIINERLTLTNILADIVIRHNYNRRRVQFRSLSADVGELNDFPRLTEEDLVLVVLIKQARSYYGEHLNPNGEFVIEIESGVLTEHARELGENVVIIRGRIQSRHVRTYYVYIGWNITLSGREAIAHYYCTCNVGKRNVVGCCSHTMCLVWYMRFARQKKLIYVVKHAGCSMSSQHALQQEAMENSKDRDSLNGEGSQGSNTSNNDDDVEDFFNSVTQCIEKPKSSNSLKSKAYSLVKMWLDMKSKDSFNDAAFLREQIFINLFIKYNTAIPSSTAVERLFSTADKRLTKLTILLTVPSYAAQVLSNNVAAILNLMAKNFGDDVKAQEFLETA
ncbi:hypothetical protein HW555_011298, partial [Spodoptera exigua]